MVPRITDINSTEDLFLLLCDENRSIRSICHTNKERNIRFSTGSEEHISIESRQDYSRKEMEQCFYTCKEICDMRAEHLNTVRRMQKGKRSKKEAPYRGVQGERCLINFEKRRASCIDSVLSEQAEQWKFKVSDWETLAKISRGASTDSTAAARRIARQDERDAQKIYNQSQSLPLRLFQRRRKSN